MMHSETNQDPAHPGRWKANLILVLVASFWGTAFLAQTYAGKTGLAFHYNGASFLLAGLVLLPLVRVRNFSKDQYLWMGVAGVLLFAGSAFQQLGLYYTKVANASFLTSLYVIFTPFLLWLFFREKPTLTHSFAAFLAVLGAFLLSVGAKFEWQLGDLLEIAGALFWGMHVVIVGKVALRFESISFAVGQFLICAFLNFSLGFFLEDFSKLFTVGVLGATAYRGLLSIGIGYTAQIWAQRFTSPNDAALIFSLEAVFASIVAAFILKESLAPPQLAGCALILLAASLSQLRPKS